MGERRKASLRWTTASQRQTLESKICRLLIDYENSTGEGIRSITIRRGGHAGVSSVRVDTARTNPAAYVWIGTETILRGKALERGKHNRHKCSRCGRALGVVGFVPYHRVEELWCRTCRDHLEEKDAIFEEW